MWEWINNQGTMPFTSWLQAGGWTLLGLASIYVAYRLVRAEGGE